jgi:hypothetical protein
MRLITVFILIFGTINFQSCRQVPDRTAANNLPSSTTNNMTDIEKLLDSTFPFVESLLKEYGEFFPLASAVKTNDSIAQVGTYDGDERPLSTKVISDLKKAFIAKRNDYKSIAIFYDVKITDPNTNKKTDAIAVFVESENGKTAYTFYYPYELTSQKELIFSESWKIENDKEIFIN